MSSGVSPAADIIIVATFCKNLYRKCRDASGEYDEISREVKNLFTVLRHLKYEVNAPESPLNRDQSLWGRQLAPIVIDCQSTLQQLDDLLQKYGRLDLDSDNPSSPRKVMWDKIRVGSNEMDQLGTIRVKLISHKTNLTLFLDTIQLRESGKMATILDDHSVQLDMILDKVDLIASRMTQRSGGSVMSTYSDDDKEVWKDFRRELVREGFSSSVLQQHKEVLRAYIREIDQNGLLNEIHPPSPNTGINPQQWLKSVDVPFSPSSKRTLDSPKNLRNDESAKQMMIHDENMKFPTTMKLERPSPEHFDQRLAPMPQRDPMRINDAGYQPRSPIPILKVPNNKMVRHMDDSEDDSETDKLSKSSKVSSQGSLIRTSDLVEMSQALHVTSVLLPGSFESHMSLSGNNLQRSIECSSRGNSSTLPLHNGSLVRRDSNTSTSNGQPVFQLAPDSQGKQIPSDALWTKISRRLVSPEVLEQDRRRYEARPEFVAVLGILSREEIQSYAIRSEAIRAARRSPSFQYPPSTEKSQRRMRETPSSDEDDSSDSDVPQNRRQRRNEPRKYTSSVAGSDTTPRSGYPNPYGVHAPPSPSSSPITSKSQHLRIPRSPHRNTDPSDSSASSSPVREERDSNYRHSRKEEERDRHHSSSRSGRSKRDHRTNSSTRSSDTNSQRNKDSGRRRWRDNLAAAGIGGAAASLLGVLSEAAEGL
ncbi:hypothetical protein HYFRA_00009322 [Hymenoscyphus fraxineus]|uniref:DUF8035 domain-containing protein n=1 Tax=Hymenoscyphus fraxineus TaxID=746836 RepID=A0A9N9L1X5_9HELO|nr:hypothetical protein HYFRA_00009322 [Hymenoscyphus fraxineus]